MPAEPRGASGRGEAPLNRALRTLRTTRRVTLPAAMRRELEELPEAESVLYLRALSRGDRQARAALTEKVREIHTAPWPGVSARYVVSLFLWLLLDSLSRRDRRDSQQLTTALALALLLVAVVLAPALYHCRRHTQPRDLLRGSVELNAPPSLRAALPLREMATAVGAPRTSP